MFKFCPKCTKEAMPGWKCCPYCGFKFKEVDSVPTQEVNAGSALDDAINNLNTFAEDALAFEIADGVLLKYNGNKEEVTIPDGVTAIGQGAFCQCHTIKSVNMPDSVTEVCNNAFSGCRNLNSVTLSKNLNRIGKSAFYFCLSLSEINFPLSLFEIGANAFQGCGLTSLTLNRNLSVLFCNEYEGYIFAENYRLTNVTFLGDKIELGVGIFRGCANLREVVGLGKYSVIGEGAFQNCTSLNRIDFPYGVTLRDSAFAGSGLKEIVIPNDAILENNVFSCCTDLNKVIISGIIKNGKEFMLPHATFAGCVNLQSVDIKPGIQIIDYRVFEGCRSLMSLILPNTLKAINCSLNDCSALKTLVIPDSVTNIHPEVLGWYHDTGCGLTEITVGRGVKDLTFLNNCRGNQIEKVTLLGVEELTTQNGSAVFGGYKKLKCISLPYTLKKIARGFSGCESLEEITIPDSVYEIGDYVFSSCTKLRKIKLSNNLNKLGKRACNDCTSLSSITLPKSLFERLPERCSLQDIQKVLAAEIFAGCVNLKAVYVPEEFSFIDISSIGAPQQMQRRIGNNDMLARHLKIDKRILKKYEY